MRFIIRAALIGLPLCLVVGVILLFTVFNATWRIHRYAPYAKVYFDPVNSPDPSWGDLMRLIGFKSYFDLNESIGVTIENETQPIRLDFARRLYVHDLTITKCTLMDISGILGRYRPDVSIIKCDLFRLPEDQKKRLHYDAKYNLWYPVAK